MVGWHAARVVFWSFENGRFDTACSHESQRSLCYAAALVHGEQTFCSEVLAMRSKALDMPSWFGGLASSVWCTAAFWGPCGQGYGNNRWQVHLTQPYVRPFLWVVMPINFVYSRGNSAALRALGIHGVCQIEWRSQWFARFASWKSCHCCTVLFQQVAASSVWRQSACCGEFCMVRRWR